MRTHHHKAHIFPDGFLWGTATSAHQVEGDNIYNDWYYAETHNMLSVKSGKACRHYDLYEQDFDLIKSMHNNAHRLSIEWSRLEPEEGRWNEKEIEHYRQVFQALKKRNIKIMLTLHHFTVPLWFYMKGGFEKTRNIRYFLRFVKKVAEEYGDMIDFWITINEPGVYIYQGWEIGVWPPFKKNKFLAGRVYLNLALAHRKAYKIIHRTVARKFDILPQVGIAQNMLSFATYRKHGLIDQLAVWTSTKSTNHGFYILTGKSTHDFIGINYYFRIRLKRKKGTLKIEQDDVSSQEREVSDMGWEIYPHGLFDVLMDMRDYEKPVYITENGIATENDDKRQRFIISHLNEIYYAVKGGVDVKGYFHWSLLDNFEWHHGFKQRFGLVSVDFRTFKRKIKKSGIIYGEIAKRNGIDHKYFKLLGHNVKV